ncbi:hypothetical protein [Aquimarina sp. AU119]|uniref:hypothetical protein n=1 Tax=Aquimarina sp. AU119 TaxID=2108528 RepID=UPI000D68F539|nr:hypothetical protein [Aquimarina sp. AU119]
MKLLIQNFSGTTENGEKYRIEWSIDKGVISLSLSYYNERLDQYNWIDIKTKEFESDTFFDSLREILIECETEWGIELFESEIESKLTA